ncbi:3'-5' exonuclease [Streptomyces sp. NPDC003077]|uniref:3'-5' exonuclease n=1 Tax=Streptomyces sp. NPDC003077 TaxID=3154443 RepID=UPI0033B2E7D6
MSEVLTASAVGQGDRDIDPDRVARGEPLKVVGGVPVYDSGRAPAFLRTKTQLRRGRRKPAPGQRPAAYISTRWYGDRVALWDPEQSARMRPLSALQRRQMQQRRTCTACGEVFSCPVWGTCRPCRDRQQRQAAKLRRRTCQVCGTVFRRPAPLRGFSGGLCLACDERLERGRKVARSLVDHSCRRCLVQLVPLAVWAAMGERERAMADWHCTPCWEEIDQERAEAQRQADRERWNDLGPTLAWAQKILAEPEAYAIVDTETTGLTATSRIVEIAVTTASGKVLLNTLVNPGEPIPAEATALHGITDAMVADAPSFSTILPRLTEALAGRRIVIYNREYDTGRLLWELHLHHRARHTVDLTKHPRHGDRRHPAAQAWLDAQQWEECAMEQYAAFYGTWHHYWRSYTWQPLGGGHRALDDCHTVITRVEEMAALPQPLRPRARDGPLNTAEGHVGPGRMQQVWCTELPVLIFFFTTPWRRLSFGGHRVSSSTAGSRRMRSASAAARRTRTWSGTSPSSEARCSAAAAYSASARW